MKKNIIFFIALTVFGLNFASNSPVDKANKEYTLSYKFFAKNIENMTDFNQTTQKLIGLFEDTQRSPENGANFYDKLLIFIKELQEAIIAGINLVGIASTSSNDTIATINEIAQTAETFVETLDEVEKIQTPPTKSRKTEQPHIEIALTISCDNPEKENLFEGLKIKMNTLAEAFNNQTYSAEELTAMLHALISESRTMGSDGKITINIAA